MATSSYRLFDTPLGWCGIAWQGERITRFVVPSIDAERARRRLTTGRRGVHADHENQMEEVTPEQTPAWVDQVIDRATEHLNGRLTDFQEVPLDLSGLADSAQAVYGATRAIPPGQTRTYGEIAEMIGQPGAAQSVGTAMGRNPVPLLVPCHRVVGADGRLVGFSADGGTALKRRLLELEEAAVVAQRTLF
ncbi:methylated-DNA--[protein]-cysteine S-methyltransferase [Euzebya tangerina]|uniref:methylated-DNA--[protein]-cysteine S-methyltransferase n=1 Tax=Euzebya tangerina TaxID=591198 RepID=UPI000E31E03C|nr:methylated-DNA--[protein]-cysteine S-methyltransferase [Euzebya tangerina]